MVLLAFGLMTPVFSGETSVLDGRIFTGTSNYSARTNDELINNVVAKVDAVILGIADVSVEPLPFHRWRWHVTVIESYKGGLKLGDKIYVNSYSDEGAPDFKEISGKKGFYFINLDERHRQAPTEATTYESSWIDVAPYDRYGEPMRKLLSTLRQHETAQDITPNRGMKNLLSVILRMVNGPGTAETPEDFDGMNFVVPGIYLGKNPENLPNDEFEKWYSFRMEGFTGFIRNYNFRDAGLYSFNCTNELHRFDYLNSTEAAWIERFLCRNEVVDDWQGNLTTTGL